MADKYCVINHVYVCFLGKYSHYLVSYSWSQVVNYKLIWGWKMSHVGKDVLIVNKTRPSIDHTLDPYHTEILQKNIDSFRWTQTYVWNESVTCNIKNFIVILMPTL